MRRILTAMLIVGLMAGCSTVKQGKVDDKPIPAANVGLAVDAPETPAVAEAPVVNPVDVMMRDAYKAEQRKDMDSALALYTSAGQQGNAQAHYELARIYAQGLSGPVDLAKSNEHLTIAFGLGHAESTRVLAWQYLRGAGVQKDVEKAKQLFGKAAVTSVRAQREVGMLYVNAYSQYPLGDITMGLEYLRKAAHAQDAEAAFYLYKTIVGLGKPTDESDDALLFAVSQEYPKALFLFGQTAMNKGRYEQAGQIYLKAALLGDRDAMFEYANNVMLKRFQSLDREVEAYTWFSIAAEYKQPQAIEEMVAQKGTRNMLDRKEPGRLDRMIAGTKDLIHPWQPSNISSKPQ